MDARGRAEVPVLEHGNFGIGITSIIISKVVLARTGLAPRGSDVKPSKVEYSRGRIEIRRAYFGLVYV